MKETGAALIFIATVIVATISCGDQPYIYGHPEEIPPGEECPSGGYWLSQGIDENGNDKLDEAEVQDKLKVCNGVFWDVEGGGEGGAKMTEEDWFMRYDVIEKTTINWENCEEKRIITEQNYSDEQPTYRITEYCKYPTIATCKDNDVIVDSSCWLDYGNELLGPTKREVTTEGAANWFIDVDGSNGWICDIMDTEVYVRYTKRINIGEIWDGTWYRDISIEPDDETCVDYDYHFQIKDGTRHVETRITCISVP